MKKIEACSTRLQLAIQQKGIKQVKLCELTGIPKSAMSQYIKGSFEPKQDRIYLLSKALDVNPVWLMGYDVPMHAESKKELPSDSPQMRLINIFSKLNPENKKRLLELAIIFLQSQEDK